jgi:hypothetical protein
MSLAQDIALGKPVTASSQYLNGFPASTFAPSNITNGLTSDQFADGSYWITDFGATPATATIDLGSDFSIGSFVLQDTTNGDHNDCGTQAFTIGVSTDDVTFTTVVTSAFTNSEWASNTPLMFSIPAATGEYVQFTADTSWGPFGISGLTELEVFQSNSSPSGVPEGSVTFGFPAAVGLLVYAARRRRAARGRVRL